MDKPDFPFERSFYIGNMLTAITYGVQLCVATLILYFMYNGGGGPKAKNHHKFYYACYCGVMVLCTTVGLSTNALLGQMMWIEHRDFPGGPPAWFGEVGGTVWYNTLGTAFFILSDIMGEALLLYRCYIIWNCKLTVIAFPLLIFLGSIAMSIMTVIESALPGSSFFIKQTTDFSLPWLSLTSVLNFLLTSLISGRLLYYRRKMNNLLSPEAIAVYTGVIALLIESAAPFTILGIILTVLLAKKSPIAIAFTCVWGSYTSIAPLLIILRVVMGRSWTKDTLQGTEIQFAGMSVVDTIQSKTATTLRSDGILSGEKALHSHDTLIISRANV